MCVTSYQRILHCTDVCLLLRVFCFQFAEWNRLRMQPVKIPDTAMSAAGLPNGGGGGGGGGGGSAPVFGEAATASATLNAMKPKPKPKTLSARQRRILNHHHSGSAVIDHEETD